MVQALLLPYQDPAHLRHLHQVEEPQPIQRQQEHLVIPLAELPYHHHPAVIHRFGMALQHLHLHLLVTNPYTTRQPRHLRPHQAVETLRLHHTEALRLPGNPLHVNHLHQPLAQAHHLLQVVHLVLVAQLHPVVVQS